MEMDWRTVVQHTLLTPVTSRMRTSRCVQSDCRAENVLELPFPTEVVSHCICHKKMRESASSELPFEPKAKGDIDTILRATFSTGQRVLFVPFVDLDESMALAQLNSQYTIPKIVPVDDQLCFPDPGEELD